MISYSVYKIIHLFSIFAVLMSLGAGAIYVYNGGSRENNKARKWLALFHGIGLVFALISGFGLLARLGLTSGLPGWIYGKLAIWLVLGAFMALVYRKAQKALLWWTLTWFAGGIAAYLAITKPF